MENAGAMFLCSCCNTGFQSALLLSQHCATHHQLFEIPPFILRSILPNTQGLIGQPFPTFHDSADQPPMTRKPSSHDITLTQLETVAPSSKAHSIPVSYSVEETCGTTNDTAVLSSNNAAKCGSERSISSGAGESDSPCIRAGLPNESHLRNSCDERIVYLTPIPRSRSESCSIVNQCDTLLSHRNLSQLQPINVRTSTPEGESRGMPSQQDSPHTIHSRLSVIQSSQSNEDGNKYPVNDAGNKNHTMSNAPTNFAPSAMAGIRDSTALVPSNPHLSSLARLQMSQQQSVLVNHTPTITMGVVAAVGIPRAAPMIKPTKPPRGQGPRPFSCSMCDKTFTLKCNLQQHEVYAHSNERPYACSECDKAFKLKGHLKEHEHNAHSKKRPFKCTQCEKSFKQNSHLTGHMAIHNGSKPHRCETCGLVFRQKQHLKRHTLTHTGKRLFSCPQCPSTFNISSDLTRHARIHSGEKPFRCAHCGKGFARKHAVKIHERIHFKPFTCQRCHKSFKDLQALGEHEKKHVKTLLHACSECGQNFSLYIELKAHAKIHEGKSLFEKKKKLMKRKNSAVPAGQRITGQRTAALISERLKKSSRPARRVQSKQLTQAGNDDEQLSCSVCQRDFKKHCYVLRHEMKYHSIQHALFQCDKCGEKFNDKHALVAHVREHKEPERYRCDQCDDTYQQVSLLKRHLVSAHNSKPHSCNICSKTFLQKKSYVEHVQKCTAERIVHCDLCHDVFKQEASLLQHKVKVHSLQPYTCSICHRGFKVKGTLDRHMLTHSSDRPHRCQYCSKTFKEKRQVDQHEMTHRGERPFQCFQCGLSFHRKAYLERHEAIHTGEKRFRCPHCPIAFFMGHDLKRHLRIHTGEKPFVCKICKKAFRRKAAAAYHEKQVHMRQFQCSYCSRKFFTKPELDAHIVVHLGVPHSQKPMENCVVEQAPSMDKENNPALNPALPLISGSPSGDCETQSGTRSVCEPSDVPSHPTSNPDVSTSAKAGDSTPSEAGGDVLFFLCNACGRLFPDATMLAKHTQLLHNPSLAINNPDPTTTIPEGPQAKHESRTNITKKDTGKSVVGNAQTHMCTACGEEYLGDHQIHECIDVNDSAPSPGPEVVEDPGPDNVDQDHIWTRDQPKDRDESLYYCGVCDKGFKKISSRNVHQRIHTGDKPFVCKTCNKAFSVKSNLRQHEKAKHTDERPYACLKCNAKFKQHSHLKSHEEIHEGIKKYECTVCHQKFRQPSHLQRHKLVHDGIKQYKCKQCPSAFNLASDLQRHSLIHSGIKPFPCEHCEKRFRRKFQLKVHLQTHTGGLPLQCPHCTRAFMDKNCFESHVSSHEGKPLHTCATCKKSFSTEYVLKHHSCGKATTRPIKCEQCSKSFKHQTSYEQHKCRH